VTDTSGRGVAAMAAVLGAGALLVLGVWTLSAEGRLEGSLEGRCDRIGAGDGVRTVFERMGTDGYRPGCGHRTPCETLDLGEVGVFDWLCDPDDCSLLWRAGDVACLIDLDPTSHVVTTVDLDEWGG